MTNRLFVALEIPEDILESLTSFRKEIYGDSKSARWEPVEKLHITLKFLGDVNSSQIPDINRSLEEVSSLTKKFNLEFEKFGLFYRGKTPSILWAGLKRSSELEKLVGNIESSFQQMNFPREKRKFSAHLTLLRIRGSEDFTQLEEFPKYEIENLDFYADKITLFKSELKRGGSVYTPVKSFELISSEE